MDEKCVYIDTDGNFYDLGGKEVKAEDWLIPSEVVKYVLVPEAEYMALSSDTGRDIGQEVLDSVKEMQSADTEHGVSHITTGDVRKELNVDDDPTQDVGSSTHNVGASRIIETADETMKGLKACGVSKGGVKPPENGHS